MPAVKLAKRPKFVSWSRVKLWRKCHRAHDFRYNERLEHKRRARPLLVGTIIHEIIDARAKRSMGVKGVPTYEDILKKYEKQYRELFEAEREVYGDLIPDIRRIMQGYERFYKGEPLKYLGSEEPLILDLSPGIKYVAVIDKRARDKDGMTWLVDHKSHRNIPDEETRFSDLQLVHYVWAWNEFRPKEQVDGILWDYIRTKPPTIPETLVKGGLTKRANIDTDYHTYLSEIQRLKLDPAEYQDVLERLKGERSKFFVRVPLPAPSSSMIREVVSDLKDTALQIVEFGGRAKDRNMTRDCSTMCEFYSICQAEIRGLDADFIRKTEYQPRKDERDDKIAAEKAAA